MRIPDLLRSVGLFGLLLAVPQNTVPQEQPTSVAIESVRVDGAPVDFRGGLELAAGRHDIEIRYYVPASPAAAQTRFKYQLEGVHRDWFDAGTDRAVHLIHVPQGEYSFRVMATAGDGTSIGGPAALRIHIAPFFYQTRWFLALGIVLFLTTGPTIYALRVRYLKASERKLADLVAERTVQLSAANEKLEALARLDGLTGIANHRTFNEFLGSEWQRSQRARAAISMLMIDVDYFKLFNDTHGHQQGDTCLRTIASVLREAAHRASDLPARYGGEEFAVVLGDTDEEGALAVAEGIRSRIEGLGIPHAASAAAPVVTVSVGIASAIPEPSADADALVGAADQALYRAKEEGRNRVCSAAPIARPHVRT